MDKLFDSFNLHFLRPELLILILLVPIFLVLIRKGRTTDNSWEQHINPVLLHAMQGDSSRPQSKRARSWLLSSLLVLLIIAASGPSWIEKPQPATQRSDNMVVILDLSLSMLAEDTPPSRLVRAKQKIVDLLKLRKEGTTALIAFSGDSFVVTPLTDDIRTIESNLSALEPFIMPVIGSRPDLAIDQARELLLKAGSARGRIVLLTDGIAEHQVERINDSLENSDISLSILSVGTSAGGPIKLPDNRGYLKDNGSVVIAKMDSTPLRILTSYNSGTYAELSLNDSDLDAIDVSGIRTALEQQENTVQTDFDQWEDLGYLFLALALPLCLLAYRQGGLLILIFAFVPDRSQALELVDLWKTQDQQAQELASNGDYDAAAGLFESPRHKADALYRAGKYEESAELYSQFDSTEGHYNRGNALARGQRIEEAIKAYEQALVLNPQNTHAAENKALLESLLAQQQQSGSSSEHSSDDTESQQQQSDNQDQSGNQSNGDKQSPEGQSSGQQDAEDGQPESASQTESKTGDQSKDSQSGGSGEQEDEQQQAPQSAEEINQMNQKAQQAGQAEKSEQGEQGQEQQNASGTTLTPEQMQALKEQGDHETSNQSMAIEEPLTTEEQRSYEQWMRRVPDDPSGLLRRKFEQQARERVQENNPEEPLW